MFDDFSSSLAEISRFLVDFSSSLAEISRFLVDFSSSLAEISGFLVGLLARALLGICGEISGKSHFPKRRRKYLRMAF